MVLRGKQPARRSQTSSSISCRNRGTPRRRTRTSAALSCLNHGQGGWRVGAIFVRNVNFIMCSSDPSILYPCWHPLVVARTTLHVCMHVPSDLAGDSARLWPCPNSGMPKRARTEAPAACVASGCGGGDQDVQIATEDRQGLGSGPRAYWSISPHSPPRCCRRAESPQRFSAMF